MAVWQCIFDSLKLYKMKYFVTFIAVVTGYLLFNNLCYGQQVISTSGEQFESQNLSVSQTIGEPLTTTFVGTSIILTQGFQQPGLKVTSIKSKKVSQYAFNLYPNPVNYELTISGQNSPEIFMVIITNNTGNVLFHEKILLGLQGNKLDFSEYIQGVYHVQISDLTGSIINTYQIVKI